MYLRLRRARPRDEQPHWRCGSRSSAASPLALFAILFFRLWFLQILNGDKYLAEANNNRTREFRVSAPRGNILDRNGNVLVANRTSLALQVNPQKLPEDEAASTPSSTQLGELIHTHAAAGCAKTMHEELKTWRPARR